MKILILTKDKFPTNRPMLIELWNKEISILGNKLFWLFQNQNRSIKIKKMKWENNIIYILPSLGSRSPISRILSFIINFFYKIILVFIIIIIKKIDFIHIHDSPEEGIISLLIKKILKIKFSYAYTFPFIDSLQNSIKGRKGIEKILKYLYIKLRKKLYEITLKQADIVFPISKYLSDKIRNEYLIPEKKILIVSECASNTFLNYSKSFKRDNKNNIKKIIYSGFIGKERNIEFIIDSMPIILNKHPNTQLDLLGWADIKYDIINLKEYIKKYNLTNYIKIIDKVPYNKVPNILSQYYIGVSPIPPIDIFLVSTPTKCIEYLSLGIPVVANEEIYDQKTLLESSNGGILTKYNVNDFALGIIVLLENEELHNKCSVNGYNWIVQNRSFKNVAVEINNKIRAIV